MTRRPRSVDLPTEADEAPAAAPPKSAARHPRTLHLDDRFQAAPPEAAQRAGTDDRLSPDALAPDPERKRFSFASLFFAALGGLASLALALAIDGLLRELFARADWLGWVGTALAALAVLAVSGIILREVVGLVRLARISGMQERARVVWRADDAKGGRALAEDVAALYASRADTATGRRVLQATHGEIVDGRDLIVLAERDLLAPLDKRAKTLVNAAAARVSVVTAISPRLFIDVAFVLAQNVKLIRQIADLYGGRPGTIGFLRLTKNVLAHLAVTGSIAMGDGLVQQLVGHGVASRLSARLGEGVVNGLLTVRIGLAAMDVCRPLPFEAIRRPGVADFRTTLTGSRDANEAEDR